MRLAFLIGVLLLSVFYTALAFHDLEFLSSRGRIAPGFFPQIIGPLTVAISLYTVILDYRRGGKVESLGEEWKTAILMVALLGILIVASHYLGALPGMLIFMLLALSILNRGEHLTNVLVGVLLPVGMYAMFRFWLNAAMPPGVLGLPF